MSSLRDTPDTFSVDLIFRFKCVLFDFLTTLTYYDVHFLP